MQAASGSSSATSRRTTRRPHAGGRARSSSRSSGRPAPPASRAPTGPRTRSAPSRCRGSRPDDDGGAPILHYVVTRGEERAPRSLRHQRVRLPQAQDRRQLQLPGAGGQPRRRRASSAHVSRSAQADTEPGRVQNIRMVDRGDGTITVAGQAPDPHLEDPRLHPHPGSAVRRRGRCVPASRCRASTTTSSTSSPSRRRTASASRCRGRRSRCNPSAPRRRRGARGHRPRVGRQPDRPACRLAGGAARGARPDGLHASATPAAPRRRRCPAARRSPSLTCTHTGVPYDGLDLHLHRVAANQPGEPANRCQPAPAPPSRPSVVRRVGRLRRRTPPATTRRPSSSTPSRTRAARPAGSRSWSPDW